MVALLLVMLLEMVEKCFEMEMVVVVVLVIVEKVRKVVVIMGDMR